MDSNPDTGVDTAVGRPWRQAGRWLRALAVAEWGTVFPDVWQRLRTARLRAVPLTLGSALGIAVLQLLQHSPGTRGWVEKLGGVYATLPWWRELLRTPLSLLVPDPSLPVWGLLVQVMVVFGIAEAALGTRRTLLVALLATLAGTCFARYSLWIGPEGFLGLPVHELRVRDTGPSAAVVALGVATACRYRARWTATAIVVAMVIEVGCVPNLAGYEHLAGIAAILSLTALGVLSRPSSRLRPA